MSSSAFSWVRCSEEGTVERGTLRTRLGTGYTLGNLGKWGLNKEQQHNNKVTEQFVSTETIWGSCGQILGEVLGEVVMLPWSS